MYSSKKMKKDIILFIHPHKTVLTEDINRDNSPFLAEITDKFARAVPSLPAMTILGALDNYENHFIDATADNPSNIFQYNDSIYLIGVSDEEVLDRVLEINPSIILMTSMFTSEYFSVNRLIHLIKRNFDIPIIIGGHHAALRPSWHLKEGADMVAIGEGEINIRKIIETLRKGKTVQDIDGIVYYEGNKIRIQKKLEKLESLDGNWNIETVLKRQNGSNRYPLTTVTRNPLLYLPKNANLSENTGVLYASRGCPYGCKFCNATDRDGKKIRHMSLERMINLTEEFISLGVNTFHNESDTFGIHQIDKEYFKWVAEQRENGRNINLVNTNSFFAKYFFHIGRFLPQRVDLLRDAGFKTITVSIESFNDKYNRGKLRGISIPLLQDCFSYIKQQGLKLEIYMMYLFPEQSKDELKNDINNIELLSHFADSITWRSLMYFPGTKYYDWAIRTKKFTEDEYKGLIKNGISFYNISDRFNFSKVKNPPKL